MPISNLNVCKHRIKVKGIETIPLLFTTEYMLLAIKSKYVENPNSKLYDIFADSHWLYLTDYVFILTTNQKLIKKADNHLYVEKVYSNRHLDILHRLQFDSYQQSKLNYLLSLFTLNLISQQKGFTQ